MGLRGLRQGDRQLPFRKIGLVTVDNAELSTSRRSVLLRSIEQLRSLDIEVALRTRSSGRGYSDSSNNKLYVARTAPEECAFGPTRRLKVPKTRCIDEYSRIARGMNAAR